MKNLPRFLPYLLCPLAFFALLGCGQYLILRHAFTAGKRAPQLTVEASNTTPKKERLPASLILP